MIENGFKNQSHLQKHRKKYLIAILFFVLVALQISTQLFAKAFDYQEALGFNVNNIYPFWSIVSWYVSYGSLYEDYLLKYLGIGFIFGLGLPLLFMVILQNILANTNKTVDNLHDTARWADFKDIEKASLLPKDNSAESVVVGGYRDALGILQILMHSGAEHILCYAPTRSGKGIGLVIPTLFTWLKSAFITDLKGELWALTAGWRKKYANNIVIKFEPASEVSARWNPLDEIRVGTSYETGDVQNLVSLLVNPEGKEQDHWGKTAGSLLVGVILHTLYQKKNGINETACLRDVDMMLSDPTRPIQELWNEMLESTHLKGDDVYRYYSKSQVKEEKGEIVAKVHPAVAQSARDMLGRPEEEAGSVLSSALSYLSLYRDPVVARNTEVSDFRIKDIMNSDKPVSVYVVTQPNDKARLSPLVRIIVNMNIRLNADKMEFEDGRPKAIYKHRMLLMLDEFPSLGKLDILQESLAFVAGYGIKCYLITQDLNQLQSESKGYGRNETITANCHIQNAYPPNVHGTAEYISKMAGNTTVVQESITQSGKRSGAFFNNISRTYQHTQRALITPNEALRMKGPLKDNNGMVTAGGEMIIFVAGFNPIKGEQVLYFQNPIYAERAKIPAPEVSDIIQGRENNLSQKINTGLAKSNFSKLTTKKNQLTEAEKEEKQVNEKIASMPKDDSPESMWSQE